MYFFRSCLFDYYMEKNVIYYKIVLTVQFLFAGFIVVILCITSCGPTVCY